MATVLRREFHGVRESAVYRITPIGDIHLGAISCDESRLKATVNRIAMDDNHFWIGMGDYCEFINMKDPRFTPDRLAEWIDRVAMRDIAKAQIQRLYSYFDMIADRCLGLVMGNHELEIMKHTERDVYSEIVNHIKEQVGYPEDHKLGVGIYGWLKLAFYNADEGTDGMRKITINMHHGFTGGKLAGAKALDMQRWLWTHEADLVLFGHVHNAPSQPEAVEMLDRNDKIVTAIRKGTYCGTFLRSVDETGTNYAEVRGYLPNPTGVIPEIELRPWEAQEKRVRIVN